MATKKFIREPKEFTTEPSDDEVGVGMKRGGHSKHKKHMAMGGTPVVGARRPMVRAPGALLMRKKGGPAELKEIHKVEKELKHHEKEAAHIGHRGLKAGGRASAVPGGLLGGVEDIPMHKRGATDGIEGPGYKKGGNAKHHAAHHAHGGKVHRVSGHPEGSHEHHKAMAKHHAAKHKEGGSAHHAKMHEHHKAHAKHLKAGGSMGSKSDAFETKTTLKPKIDVKDKVHEAKQAKSFHTKTEGLEGVGYKKGGHLKKFAKGGSTSASKYLADMKDGEKMPTKKRGTGEIKEDVAGYKRGGHVKHEAHGGHVAHHAHKATHKAHGGHMSHHEHSTKHHAHGGHVSHKEHMAHGGSAKKHHTTKVSTHKAKGGKCNY